MKLKRSGFFSSALRYRGVVCIVTATFAMVFFTYCTPPIKGTPFLQFLEHIPFLKGDYPVYISRFFLSLLLLGIIPFSVAKLYGLNNRDLGLTIRIAPFKFYHILIFLLLSAFFGVTGGLSEELSKFYPYSQTLVQDVIEKGWYFFILHVVLYGLLYYAPWEFFFRGFLMLLFINTYDELLHRKRDLLWIVIAFQTIPSTLLHFGHPVTELLSAIPAGLVFGWLVYKSRSIFPAFLLHFAVGVATDATIIIQQGGF